jgi:hypothetical protein
MDACQHNKHLQHTRSGATQTVVIPIIASTGLVDSWLQAHTHLPARCRRRREARQHHGADQFVEQRLAHAWERFERGHRQPRARQLYRLRCVKRPKSSLAGFGVWCVGWESSGWRMPGSALNAATASRAHASCTVCGADTDGQVVFCRV